MVVFDYEIVGRHEMTFSVGVHVQESSVRNDGLAQKIESNHVLSILWKLSFFRLLSNLESIDYCPVW